VLEKVIANMVHLYATKYIGIIVVVVVLVRTVGKLNTELQQYVGIMVVFLLKKAICKIVNV